jgi:hypothetical protein
VLKIFNPDFAKRESFPSPSYRLILVNLIRVFERLVGLLYVILSILLLLIAQYRRRRSDEDFTDLYRRGRDENENGDDTMRVKASERIWGREFRTSGDMVILIGLTCTALYVAMFVLVMKLPA